MSLLNLIREKISPQNPFLLLYHKFLAVAAAIFYGFPANKLKVIAITGTKGKSTTAHLLTSILQQAGHKTGCATTIHFQIGENIWTNETKQTTQGPFLLQKLLRMMVRERCEFAVLEVTSHALNQSRLWGVNVDSAVLTNIERDHIEYHGGFEQYLHAKGKLFSDLVKTERKFGLQKTAILPSEDPNVAYFESFSVDRTISYGITKGTVQIAGFSLRPDGSRFTLKIPNDEIEIEFKLAGEFNVKNAVAAAAAAVSFGIGLKAVKKGLEAETQIPGRLEPVRLGQPFSVIVDYAHTEESLEKVLSLFKSLTKGRLFAVFGAPGGGRDRSKRPKMGAVADKYADYVIVTDDDPYTENRIQIIEDVSKGINRKEGEKFWRIRDRKQAIRLALSLAREGDTVVIAGKGCEPVQVIGDEKIKWDDREVVREILTGNLKVAL